MSNWITDRLPTDEDGSNWLFGQVWLSNADGVYATHWSEVNEGQPWQPILHPEPYVKPSDNLSEKPNRWTAFYSQTAKSYTIWCDEVFFCILPKSCTQSAARRIAEVFNEVLP